MTDRQQGAPIWRQQIGWVLGLAVAYTATAWLCLELARHPGSIAAIWYANAVAICYLTAAPRSLHPVLLFTTAATITGVNMAAGSSLAMSLGFAFGNSVEIGLGVWTLERLGNTRDIASQPLLLLKLLMWQITLVSATGATFGTLTLDMAGVTGLSEIFTLWWIGDAIGMASVLPLGIIALGKTSHPSHFVRAIPRYALSGGYGVAITTFCSLYLPFPYIYIAALLVSLGIFFGLTAITIAAVFTSLTLTTLISFDVLQPSPNTPALLFYLPILLAMVLPVVLAAYVTRSQLDNAHLAKLTEARKEQADQLRAVLAAMPDGLLTVTSEGIVKSGNAAAAHLFGYPAMALMGMPIRQLLPPELQTPVIEMPSLLHGSIGTRQERIGVNADGGLLTLDVATESASRDNDGLLVITLRDISASKKIAKLKAQFVATVSHELRTPLTAVTGAIEVLTHGGAGELDPQAMQLLDLARRNGLRLKTLVNDLLDMEKLAAGKLSLQLLVQDVRPLLTSVCETNQPLGLTKQVQLNATIPDTPLIAKVDSSRLQQVLTNLIANAIKFSPEHSTVQLTARRDGDLLEVTVRDQGPGIPEAFKAHLFEQFAQADAGDNRQHAGTGLGLAISKALIEQMRGEIGYRTPSGPGAEFFVRLPLSSPETD